MSSQNQGSSHVVIIVQNLSVPTDRRVWLECRSLQQAGYAVSVICPRAAGELAFEVLADVRIHRYRPPPAARGLGGLLREAVQCWLSTLLTVIRIARRERIDVIQACNPPDTYFALAALFRLTGTKFVYDQHDLCPELASVRYEGLKRRLLVWVMRVLEAATYRTADHVISTNESYRQIAQDRGRVPDHRSSVVRSGPVSTEMVRGEPRPELREDRQYLVCYLGIMGPQDGVELLIEAVSHLVHDHGRTDTTFALLGFGDCLADLEELVAERGLEPWVTFTGRADDAMISAYLSTADIAVAPDPKNEFNDRCTMNKVIEYMAFGVPVVSFDLRETRVSAGPAAVYVEDDDPAALAKAIESLLADEEKRSQMGAIGRARVESRLAWESQEPAYVEVFDGLVGRPHGETVSGDDSGRDPLPDEVARHGS